MVTFVGDTEVLDETMVADGSPRPAAEKDCTGARSIHWAARGPRLFSSSTLTCSGQPDLRTSSVLSLVVGVPATRAFGLWGVVASVIVANFAAFLISLYILRRKSNSMSLSSPVLEGEI